MSLISLTNWLRNIFVVDPSLISYKIFFVIGLLLNKEKLMKNVFPR